VPTLYRKSKVLRRSRVIWGSIGQWKGRLIFWVGALATGVVSVGFAELADLAQQAFHWVRAVGPTAYLLPLAITPIGFMLSAYLATVLFPNAQGSGIPQTIAARHFRDDEDRRKLLSLRIAVGKIVLTVLGLACGASIGREGPTVQVGGSIMLTVARFVGMAQARGLILAGSAAGIAAAFNTPIAGIVFAIEEMSRMYESRVNGVVLTAVVLSGLAALGLAGSYSYFGEASAVPTEVRDWVLVVLCGVGGGVLGAGFSGFALYAGRKLRQWVHHQPLRRAVLAAGLCGLAVAVIGVTSGGTTFGTGYEEARDAVEGHALPLLFFVQKFAASFLTMLSGIPGGIFAPSLSVGAGFGSTMGSMLGTSIALAAILGMAGYFSAVVQAPMTAFVIIVEMTGDHRAIIPIMAVSMIGYVTSRILSHEPLYHGLSRVFIASVIRSRRSEERTRPAT
jgi:H+/Cl- antiporter ClcA